MSSVELHRTTSRSWYSVGSIERVEDSVRFVRERIAVGDETSEMMGGSVERHMQLAGRWFAVKRGKLPGLPAGMSDAARRRQWKGDATQTNHRRFVAVAAALIEPDLLADFERKKATSPEYADFLERWRRGLRQALAEFAWTRKPRGEVRPYLIGSAVREAKREHIRREIDRREAAARTSSRSLHAIPAVARSPLDEQVDRDDFEKFLEAVKETRAPLPAGSVEAAVYDRFAAWAAEARSSADDDRPRLTVRDAVGELYRLLNESDPALRESVVLHLRESLKTA